MRIYKFFAYLLVLSVACGTLLISTSRAEASSLPPWPYIYSGSATIAGAPAADGAIVTAKIGSYTSVGVAVKDGRYVGLAVGGPDVTYVGKTITFHLDDMVVAEETDVFRLLASPELKSPFDLAFPAYPTPTPLPTATATSTPIATATPDVPGAMRISGVVELDYGAQADLLGANIVARVGSYFSEPAILEENYGVLVFDDLLVDPRDHKFIGSEISFLVGGLAAYGNTAVFESNGGVDLALRVAFPTPTVVPLPSPVPSVPVAATSTSVPIPPTSVPTVVPTVVPPATPIPAPPTAVPPSPVVVVVTATPESEPEEAIVEESGGCSAPGSVAPLTGAANALMMLSPLMLIGAYKGMKLRKRKAGTQA
tara:strand:+ start:119 stop:1222 length:1104 start_codon:yes stop_codon:yes gene_type:complete